MQGSHPRGRSGAQLSLSAQELCRGGDLCDVRNGGWTRWGPGPLWRWDRAACAANGDPEASEGSGLQSQWCTPPPPGVHLQT